MVKQISFTKYENKVLPGFRHKINKAESTEDVKKFFFYTARELFEDIFEMKNKVDFEDIVFMPNRTPHYKISRRLNSSNDFRSIWKNSDLSRVISNLAESAMHRYKHLEKHPEKTETKIRM